MSDAFGDAPPGHGAGSGTAGGGENGDDLVGTVLAGRYRILSRLGVGAMGAVYLAEHMVFGRRDAIKVLRGELARDPEAIARFARGARNVSAIQHPNVCAVYDCSDTADGVLFLAMEYIPGETLKDLVEREGALPVEAAVRLTLQAAAALEAAHDAGIVHRDLKPANIMLARRKDGSPVVKVVDFDIAKGPPDAGESEVTRLGFVVGTPEYMSPEQLMGERLDGRSDVYSLALVLFRMLTGTLPFRAATTQDVMIQRLTERPLRLVEAAPGRSFPDALQAALDTALERRQDDRFGSAAEFARALATAVPAAAESAPEPAAGAGAAPEGELPPTRVGSAVERDAARQRTTVIVAAAAAVVILAGAGTALLVRGGGDSPAPAQASVDSPAAGGPVDVPGVEQAPAATDPAPAAPPPTAQAGGTPVQAQPSAPPEPTAPAPAPAIPATAVPGVLARIETRLGPPDPGPAALQAILDTAELVWSEGEGSVNDRARAAFIAGNALFGLGRPAECVTWLQRALTLRPGHAAYDIALNACRGAVR